MLSRQYIDNNMRASAWSYSANKDKKKNVPDHLLSSTTAEGDAGSKSTYGSADRCCTVCAGGLFLPRQMTDSDEAAPALVDVGSMSMSMSLSLSVSSPARNTRGTPASPTSMVSPTSMLSSPSWSSSRKLERFEQERRSSSSGGKDLPEVARIHQDEILLGKKYGKGGSSTVFEVTGFNLGHVPANAAADKQQQRQQQVLREAITGSFPQKDRYVLKKLSTRIESGLPDDKYARACAINLVLEANILRVLNHPNVLKLHGMSPPEEEAPYLILTCLPESMELRILHWRNLVRKQKKHLSTSGGSMWRMVSAVGGSKKQAYSAHIKLRKLLWERLHVGRDIARAVDHLHSKGIIYRDLKVSNIGFDSSGVVKIFDFGISRFLPRSSSEGNGTGNGNDEETFAMSKAGTKMFMAPEVMGKQPYNCKADVYSFGVLLWQLLAISTPKPLIDDLNSCSTQAIGVDQFPIFDFPMCPCWPATTRDLIQSLMSLDARGRPSMEEAHVALTYQLEKLKRAFTQQDSVPVLSAVSSVRLASSQSFRRP
ncbi:SPS1-related proline-alanine-rich protein kinase [Seminavis robusta]|uniref:SPS1-related proline-alanine-rich protein kinase n=1 Tax=Seminavis robusta TaxID=568900 RepID=A0A9N8D8V9_9STRA|nr:SPS1-related proline-alanine-rich protein kinase [Seminavis robusta]|eukprot:Sro1_g000340.1 SPS1-related proline-alanine-rich protein kinase (540) ;mRNA; r:96999-98828